MEILVKEFLRIKLEWKLVLMVGRFGDAYFPSWHGSFHTYMFFYISLHVYAPVINLKYISYSYIFTNVLHTTVFHKAYFNLY